MALDTLRAALWPPPDVVLDYTGRWLHGRRHRPVRTEHYNWWRDWRIRPGMAADCGGVVCASDGVPADCRVISALWKSDSLAYGNGKSFP